MSPHSEFLATPQRLLDVLGALAALSDEDGEPAQLLERLCAIPGVGAARLVDTRVQACSDGERAFPLLADSNEQGEHRVLLLKLTDAAAFAVWEPLLVPFCAALAQLLQARRLRGMAQHMRAQVAQWQRSEQRFRDLFDHSPDPCWIIEDGRFIDCNHAAVQALGYERREDILQHPSRLSPAVQPDGRPSFEKAEALMEQAIREGVARFEWEHCRADGSPLPVEVTLARIELQGRHALYCVWRDITERRQAQEAVHHLAFFDSLTGLPNRRLLLDRLQQSMAASLRSGKHRALLYLDLDHFKNLNDTRGHALGDRLLVQVGARLQVCVRSGDTVARLGGDEFVLLIEQLDTSLEVAVSQAGRVGRDLVEQLARPYELDGLEYEGSVSVGITLFRGQDASVDELLKRADMAMYQAKASGRNTLCFFDPAIQARIAARAVLEAQLRHAAQCAEFELYYQPQVRQDGACVAAEALLRWRHPQHGMVGPQEFIALAEETGLILALGRWVLQQACRTLQHWQANPMAARLSLAINVSARQLREPGFVDEVRAVLQAFPVDPALLKLEITESMLLDNIEQSISTMRALKALGVCFSLDDFGTGYSSLNYVKRLPLDQIKIDQSFVRDILLDPNDAAICRTIVAMGRSLGLHVVAEGVETEAQWQLLLGEGCDIAQGYLFGRPMPLQSFDAWLALRRG